MSKMEDELESHMKGLESIGYDKAFIMIMTLHSILRKDPDVDKKQLEKVEKMTHTAVENALFKAIVPLVCEVGLKETDVENIAHTHTEAIFKEITSLKEIRGLKGNN